MKTYLVNYKCLNLGKLYIILEYGYDTDIILSPVIAITQQIRNKKIGIMLGFLVFNASITIEKE
jgi:hypothetical protein